MKIFIKTLLASLLFSYSNSLSSCKTCLSLVSSVSLLENTLNTSVNSTKALVKLTCDKCPVMNNIACSTILDHIETIYNECDQTLLNCEKSCYDLGLCTSE